MLTTIIIYAAFIIGVINSIIHFAHLRKPSSKPLAEADKVGEEVVAEIPQVEAALGVKPPQG
jgi:hypothetical protein